MVVIGAGPSLTEAQLETVRASGARTIVINRVYEWMPDADWLHAGDPQFWKHYKTARRFAGRKTTLAPEVATDGVEHVRSTGREGFDRDPACCRSYGSSGLQAVALAAHTGARRIVLLGMDGQAHTIERKGTNGQVIPVKKLHWHGDHSYPCTNPQPQTFVLWQRVAKGLAFELKRLKREVVNATPGSALDAWPMMDLEESLQ